MGVSKFAYLHPVLVTGDHEGQGEAIIMIIMLKYSQRGIKEPHRLKSENKASTWLWNFASYTMHNVHRYGTREWAWPRPWAVAGLIPRPM